MTAPARPRQAPSRLGRVVPAVLAAAALALTGCSATRGAQSPPTPAGAATSSSPTASASTATPVPSGSTDPALARFYDQKPRWAGCGDGFQCTTIEVPIDYAHPADGSISLAVNRLPAAERGRRLGSLVVNPGGPGGSGLDYARAASTVVSPAVRARYDVVGFDPRGVGKSTPVRCLSDRQTDVFLATDGSPDTGAEEQRLVDESKLLGQQCEKAAPKLLPHLGTVDAARDMDVLRAVLGDPKLNYLGKSYGTFLGATYAEEFPSRVGRFVLDGALDPTSSTEEVNREQALGFETALTSFVDDCLRRPDCPLPGPRQAALAEVGRILDRADAKPLSSDTGRPVTQALAVLGVVASLYDQSNGWPLLRQGLSEAKTGVGTTLLLLADFYSDRNEDGTYASNSNDVIYAVSCLDKKATGDLATLRADAASFTKVAPRFGAYLAWSSLPCAYWPAPPTDTPHPIRAAGSGPIVVVGTLRDPATPYVWAKNLAGELANGHLLTWDGDGHTAYRRGSSCIDAAVDAYYLQGTVPPAGKTCR
ncbi:MAG TPA: alpha/beta fold hydrolase [Motilibacteraceae bacterium]|nr:alpha/beta fold hydrolase [Motilibacteraceae bacterium]